MTTWMYGCMLARDGGKGGKVVISTSLADIPVGVVPAVLGGPPTDERVALFRDEGFEVKVVYPELERPVVIGRYYDPDWLGEVGAWRSYSEFVRVMGLGIGLTALIVLGVWLIWKLLFTG